MGARPAPEAAPRPLAPIAKPAPLAAAAAPPLTEGEPITMPFGDLTVSEGRIVRWVKAVGDAVKSGELVVEIETDKAVVEVEAPVAGILARIEQPVGATVPMGGRLGVVTPAR
jgi:2-oxoisovalerate dehydrogenase E1 component